MIVANQRTAFSVASIALLLSFPALAQNNGRPLPEVNNDVAHGASLPLRNIKPNSPNAGPPSDKPLRLIRPNGVTPNQTDPALQNTATQNVATTNGLNFAGVGVGFTGPQGTFSPNAAPPDPNGAVGSRQYVQWVNESFAVFDKATGNPVYGPVPGNTIWQGFAGGKCGTNNDGDPIAQYDKIANRWIMTQFSVTGGPPYFQCVAVSTTDDATGSYSLYAFQEPNFNDYPKLGVWPDGYYISYNMFQGNTFAGGRACALERSAMLQGLPAREICFQLSTAYGGLLPSDLDGSTLPPAGSPNFFVAFGTNSLDLWRFHADFSNTANSTFAGPINTPVAAFSEACNGGTCIPQLGTTQQLDSLGDRLMYRLAYRNFGDHEALVVNHSVTAAGSVGVRWYELRSPNQTPTVFQQGTYAPDSNYRWMGSIAMDKAGNIALGYSVSGTGMNPSVRYTGRAPTDPLNTLQAETSLVNGGGSQLRGLSRWGDYSAMAVDPVDDCTFWYTTEYLQSSGTFNWSTRIASFKFPSCGGTASPDFSISETPASQTVVQGSGTSYQVTVTAMNGFTGNLTLTTSGLPTGANGTFSTNPIITSGTSTLNVTTSSALAAGSYPFTITGTSGTLSHSTSATLVVTAAASGDFSITATPPSQTIGRSSSTTYTVTVTPTAGFNGTVNLTASLPPRTNGSFAPSSLVFTGSSSAAQTSILTVNTNKNTQLTTFTIPITGTSGSLTHQTTVSLNVQ